MRRAPGSLLALQLCNGHTVEACEARKQDNGSMQARLFRFGSCFFKKKGWGAPFSHLFQLNSTLIDSANTTGAASESAERNAAL